MLRTQAARFFHSLSRLTWLPLPAFAREGRDAGPCVGAFPLVGALVGLAGALMYLLAAIWLSPALSVLLALSAMMLLTGASSEAAWARLGPRAGIAAGFAVLARLVCLLELSEEAVPVALLVAMPLACLAAIGPLFALEHPVATDQPALLARLHPSEIPHRGRVVAVAFGLAPLLLLTPLELMSVAGAVVVVVAATLVLLRRLRVDALTGMHISAIMCEIAVYLAFNLPLGSTTEQITL